MALHIKWYHAVDVGCLRAGKLFLHPPDDYEFSCMVLLDGSTAELIGGNSEVESIFTLATLRTDLRKELKAHNVDTVIYDRYKDGKLFKHYEIKI